MENIFLIGPMGAGKTTAGRQLARKLKLKFIDTDREIEKRTGADIPLIFEKEGEAGFRDREAKVIDELTTKKGIVLATGGGAILRSENREHLAERGKVIYLKTSVAEQLRRTKHDRNRPLLQTEDPGKKLEELFKVRDPLYTEIADIIVDTDGNNVQSLVSEIIQKIS